MATISVRTFHDGYDSSDFGLLHLHFRDRCAKSGLRIWSLTCQNGKWWSRLIRLGADGSYGNDVYPPECITNALVAAAIRDGLLPTRQS